MVTFLRCAAGGVPMGECELWRACMSGSNRARSAATGDMRERPRAKGSRRDMAARDISNRIAVQITDLKWKLMEKD